jgi:HNH endonuclease
MSPDTGFLWALCQRCGDWRRYLFVDTSPARGLAPGVVQRPACHSCALGLGLLDLRPPEQVYELLDWSAVDERHHRYCWDCAVERFFAHVGEPDANGCRPWLKERTYEGYGRFRLWIAGKWRHPRAHRVMWSLHHGPILSKYVVDHTCENTWCVALEHLEPVTNAENLRRYYARKRARLAREEAARAGTA